MCISVISLFENNKHVSGLIVYLVGENIPTDSKEALEGIGKKYGREISIIDLPDLDILEFIVSSRWPKSAYTRLFSALLLPKNIDRILYLDCDTIIKGDIGSLRYIDFCQNVFFGVKDCVGNMYKKNIGLGPNDVYINAGVLLINLDKLRLINVNLLIENYLKTYIRLINYADQDVLNGVFRNQIGVLSPRFNVMTINSVHSFREICMLRRPTGFYSESELKDALTNQTIIHYTTNMLVIRPWYRNTNHPFANEFRKYMTLSLWESKKLYDMRFESRGLKFISIILKLPKSIAYRLLGFIHSEIKPLYTRLKSRIFICFEK